MTQQLDRARLLINYRRYSEAQNEIVQYLSAEPYDSEAHALLAIVHLSQLNIDEARKAIEAAISLAPDEAFNFYISSKIFFHQENYIEAKKNINHAIAIHPLVAEYYAWLAQLQMHSKDYGEALATADEGLALEADNINCLNIRAIALTKLNQKEEAYQTIRDALTGDPENSLTHANTGWSLLEHGDYKPALKHFTEALRLQPNNEWAKSGMVEALKARYIIYRLFLRYMFWIGKMKSNKQWMIIIGLYVLVQLLKGVSNRFPAIEMLIAPLLILYGIFAFSTWIIQPLFNLLMLIHPQGKYALTKHEQLSAGFVGVSLLIGLLSVLLMFFYNENDGWFALAVFAISFSLPLANIYKPVKRRNRLMLQLFAAVLGVAGLISIMLAFAANPAYQIAGLIYLGLLLAFQFMANYLNSR